MNSVSKNVRVVNVFAIQQFSSFLVDISLDIACKDVKVVQIAQVEQLFQVWNLICMYNELFKGQTRVLMTQKYKQWRRKDHAIHGAFYGQPSPPKIQGM